MRVIVLEIAKLFVATMTTVDSMGTNGARVFDELGSVFPMMGDEPITEGIVFGDM
jgi:hypothetical protein